MRLDKVDHGHTLPNRLRLMMVRMLSRREAPDALKMLLYRKSFFGGPFSTLCQEVMRGPSDWSVGERELLAAFVARINQCDFCIGVHGAAASLALGEERTMAAVLDDWTTADVDPRIKATLAFLHKLTTAPDALSREDAAAVRAAGVSEAALRDAIEVATLFAVLTRLADALRFAVHDDAGNLSNARLLLRFGYE
jgi:uncharacterized peroxidase-related enzyme